LSSTTQNALPPLVKLPAAQPRLGEQEQGVIYFVLASLMVAEERITTKFRGLVAAGSSEEDVTFLPPRR
jgi:hypothetical protein